MFIVQDEIEGKIKWPVRVYVALDGGKSKFYEFTGTFVRLSDDQKKQLEQETNNDGSKEWLDAYIERTMKVMTDWEDVVNKKKDPIEYNALTFEAALKSPNGLAIINAINTAIHQIEAGIKVKNL